MPEENKDAQPGPDEPDGVKITIIYDNNSLDAKLKPAWGFSCLIEGLEKKILFDTGGDDGILLENMKSLNIDPNEISAVILSHDHWDHTGGLKDFLTHNKNVVVYLLPYFSRAIKENINKAGAKFVEITSPASICEKAAITGRLGTSIEEQSLVVETKKGLVIITGCAHPGIVKIIEHAKRTFKQDVFMVFGGFHLGSASDSEIKTIIKQFRKNGVKKAGPCHCSGELCRELFRAEYKEDFVEIGAGRVITLE